MTAAVKRDGEAKHPVRKTTVSSKNQVTLPVAVLAAAHVASGDVLRVKAVEDGVILLERYRDPRLELFEQLAGSMPGLSAETNLEALRDEWER
jgi:bifunctional DNA-binding transcriptional regulator/antitoxin component of YhaV-PrlF toxin-antitoxin module